MMSRFLITVGKIGKLAGLNSVRIRYDSLLFILLRQKGWVSVASLKYLGSQNRPLTTKPERAGKISSVTMFCVIMTIDKNDLTIDIMTS